MDPMTKLDQVTTRYRETEAEHKDARSEAVIAVVDALRAGKSPTEVTQRSPFTAAYVRQIARKNGIEPAKPGPKKGATASAVRHESSSEEKNA
jgi:hypothetical protein